MRHPFDAPWSSVPLHDQSDAALLMIVATVLLSACGGEEGDITGPTNAQIEVVSVTPAGALLEEVGATMQFSAEARDTDGDVVTGVQFLWQTSDPRIASVDTAGLVVASGIGEATITASARGVPGHAAVHVRPTRIVSVSAGWEKTCVTTEDLEAFCWGAQGGGGQLGNGSATEMDSIPTLVEGGHDFSAVSARGDFSCALSSDGSAWCWGYNMYGQLGDGSTTTSGVPVEVSGGLTFVSLSANGFAVYSTPEIHSSQACGLTDTGAAYCWGGNSEGQLGIDNTRDQSTPMPVAGGFSFQQISTGSEHTCGLTTLGVAYCWGANGDGQLGDGTTTPDSVPRMVSGGLSFEHISAGGSVTCAVTTDEVGYCWGRGGPGMIGNGSTLDRTTPQAISGGLSFRSVSTGLSHVCGVSVPGVVYCWGANNAGQLGDGTLTSRTRPATPATDRRFVDVSAGDHHTCALSVEEEVFCWGDNRLGALGDGTTASSLTPVRVRWP